MIEEFSHDGAGVEYIHFLDLGSGRVSILLLLLLLYWVFLHN